MHDAVGIEIGVTLANLGQVFADQWQFREIAECKKPGAQSVIEIVGVVGDVVGNRRALGFQRGVALQIKVKLRVELGDRQRQRFSAAERAGKRTIVLDQPFQRLPAQIETVEFGIAVFQLGDDPERLCVVVEAAEVRHQLVERILAGMAERRVAEIMGKRQRLGQILVDGEGARQRPGNLRHLDGMGQPRAVVIALVIDEDLGLVLEPAKGGRMDDAVAVALKRRSGWGSTFGIKPAFRLPCMAGKGCQPVAAGRSGQAILDTAHSCAAIIISPPQL